MKMDMEARYQSILSELEPYAAQLVAVSKIQPVAKIQALYDFGHRIFGENRVQELLTKIPQLPEDVQWHLIGQLQTNKVKDIVGKCALIHGVDRLKLAKKINEESQKKDCITPILIQLKIGEEASKSGYAPEQLFAELNDGIWSKLTHIKPCGVMGMATFTDDTEQIRREFQELKSTFDTLKSDYFKDVDYFREISMGMSGDYPIALEEGATMVRIGSKLFGPRHYT